MQRTDCTLTLLHRRYMPVGSLQTVSGSFANHIALRPWTIFWSFAFPCASRLLANIPAGLVTTAALHVAPRLAALSLAMWAVLRWADFVLANNCAIWCAAHHFADASVEATATGLALGRIALRSANLVTLLFLAFPMALRGAVVVRWFIFNWLHLTRLHDNWFVLPMDFCRDCWSCVL